MALQRLGVLGGTFDPPHYGHLTLAENALAQLGLAQVLFVVAGRPPHKPKQPISDTHHRLAMVEAAIAGNPAFVISRVEIERPGPHYTAETLTLLQREWPAAEFFFLMGGDSLAQLLAWRDPAGIVQRARLAVMRRPGYTPDLNALEQVAPEIRERLIWIDAPQLDISSSDLRRRIRDGLPLRDLLPPAVESYIRAHGLYRET